LLRALEAYGTAIALTIIAGAFGMAIFGGQALLVATLNDRFETTFPGLLGIIGVVVLGLPPALVAARLVGMDRERGRARIATALTSGVVWAGWFLLLGLAALLVGWAPSDLEWNPLLSIWDVATVVAAGAVFAELIERPHDHEPAADPVAASVESPAVDQG
jgi:hypothetical protein